MALPHYQYTVETERRIEREGNGRKRKEGERKKRTRSERVAQDSRIYIHYLILFKDSFLNIANFGFYQEFQGLFCKSVVP